VSASRQFYSPSQPRYPKGHPLGGQWMPKGGAAGAAAVVGEVRRILGYAPD
jgi:hypothetical protein